MAGYGYYLHSPIPIFSTLLGKKNTNSIQPTKLQKLWQITKLLKFLAFCGLNRVSSLFVHQEIQEKFWKNRVTSVQQRDPTFAKLIWQNLCNHFTFYTNVNVQD